jgi:cobalt/nickel transport system ATP-binding protein
MQQNDLMINLAGVSFNYPGGPPVLNQLNFQFKRGHRIGLIAPNGSGKTTLLHLIM